jgi:site-specific recombinase XerC
MHASIDLQNPKHSPSERRRELECQKAAAQIVRQLVVQMVQAGWRESEAALSLGDAIDDYCLYLAEHPTRNLEPANSNSAPFAS